MATDNYDRMRGFSLLELIMAMAIGLIVLSTAYTIFAVQNKSLKNQEQIVEMQQNVRAAMDMVCRDVRMAGYNPARATFAGVIVDSSQLEIKTDLDGDAAISSQEDIVYALDSSTLRIMRSAGGSPHTLAENIEGFTFQYLDAAGNVTAANANVRMIGVTIRGRTALPDPLYHVNGGYRTYTLTSKVIARNLAF